MAFGVRGSTARRDWCSVAATMTIDRLRRFFDAWNDHDVETIVSTFTPDGAYFASIGPDAEGTAFRGTAEVRRGVAAFLGTYGAVHYADLVIGMDGDRGFASWTFSATRPDGEQVSYRGVDLFTFDGDLIALKDAYRKERSKPIGG
jgi:taurine dehydrogenase small subunit